MRSETDGNYEDFHYFRAAGNKTQEQGTNYHNHPFSPGLYSSLHVPLLFYLKKKKKNSALQSITSTIHFRLGASRR